MPMQIYYGTSNIAMNVTYICMTKLRKDNIITIPSGENNRTTYFSDPLEGILKKIIIINHDKSIEEYDNFYIIQIDIINNKITAIDNKIGDIHSKLKIVHGNFNSELPEQKMVLKYLTGNEKVLEIGGNIGRNSLIIAFILGNNNNFVTLESDKNIAKQLIDNKNLNNFKFYIENSALSNRKLIQTGWDTIPSDILKEGYSWVNTITFVELKAKYNIDFDTLVLDCEGAFYYILMDTPEILNNIKLIIMENDYNDISHKNYIDDVLKTNNFYRDYVEGGGWGPCCNNFFEVWKR